MHCLQRQNGFTLIELLSALALGSLFILGTLSLYQSVKKTHLTAERQTELAQNFISIRTLIKNATGDGDFCQSADRRFNYTVHDEIWADITGGAFEVHPVGASDPALKAVGNSRGRRAADSDVLLIRTVLPPLGMIKQHSTATGHFVISHGIGLREGGLAAVCDGRDVALLKITAVNGTGVDYQMATTATVSAGAPAFGEGAVIAAYAPLVFYVGRSGTGSGLSLYRQRSIVRTTEGNKAPALHSEEVVDNVARMRARLAVRQGDAFAFQHRAGTATIVGVAVDMTLAGRASAAGDDERERSFFFSAQNL